MNKIIGIIGTGQIGGAIARLAVKAGYNVIVSNSQGPESLAGFVKELGSKARAATADIAALEGDIVVLATPLKAYESLQPELYKGKVVVDTMNYYPFRENQIPVLDEGKITSSALVQNHLAGAKVVKALNTQDSIHLLINSSLHNDGKRTTLTVAGDDSSAKEKVMKFINDIGYNAIDIGTLADSWHMEPGTPIYVWPYAPNVPEEMSEAEQEKFYSETPATPISPDDARNLIAKAVRKFPIGGFPQDLPKVWTVLVRKLAAQRT